MNIIFAVGGIMTPHLVKGTPRIVLRFQRLADDVHCPGAGFIVERQGSEAMKLPGSGPFGLLVEQETSDLVPSV